MKTGLEMLLEGGLHQISGKRVGLITNHTGVDRDLRSTIDLLHQSPAARLSALFGPEHGVRGEAQAGVVVADAVDRRTGLPVHSLYGDTQRPTPDMLRDLDALVFDVQDGGVRFYTYLATLAYALDEAAAAGIEMIVLDRPNPLTGTRVAGGVLDPGFTSFVGPYPVPIRHGMTSGEFARLYAGERDLPAPTVVAMTGWRRDWWFDETGLIWVPPSPNLPTMDSLTVYPGTCLVEGTNVSEGRGTTRPFEVIGAPWLDPHDLAEALSRRDLDGVLFRPTWFTPSFSKHAGESCGGVQIHVLDRTRMNPVEVGLNLLDVLRSLGGERFAWRRQKDGSFPIDHLLGSDMPRHALDDGGGVDSILRAWDGEVAAFRKRREPHLLYE